MKQLNKSNYPKESRKVKIMQFGEGNFLRAFVDWIIQDLNDKKAIDAGVVVVQPMPVGRIEQLKAQDGLYTLCLEGIEKGKTVRKHQIIDVLEDFVNPYTQYQQFLKYAESSDLEVVLSNTTEAGISLDSTDLDFSSCPKSFPSKLLALLKHRYDFFNGDLTKGLAIIPCELIDNNGTELKNILVELSNLKGFDKNFENWLVSANHFTDTLVDRIVPGYPKDTAEQIQLQTGYFDDNIVKAEVFHLWVLKKDSFIQKKFPADATGLNVLFVDDIKPYKQRKVKILNGAHTAMVPVAYLCGCDTVGQSVSDKDIRKFVDDLINDEIKPTINLPKDQMDSFSASVLERFENPFIRHELMSIALNSTTKFRTRLLPSYDGYVEKFNQPPKHILFAFSAMCVFYRGKRGNDDTNLVDNAEFLEFWKNLWKTQCDTPDKVPTEKCSACKKAGFDYLEIAKTVLSATEIWHQNLATPENIVLVAKYIEEILKDPRKALQDLGNRPCNS